MDLKLDGKVALVTGSSKGIGEGVARALAREGAIVIVHGRNKVKTEEVAHDIVALGGRAFAVFGDLTNDDEVRRQRDPALLEYLGNGMFQTSVFPIPPTQSAVRRLNQVAMPPPSIVPSGIVPHTIQRMAAFIRPCNRSGVIAWRRLTCVML